VIHSPATASYTLREKKNACYFQRVIFEELLGIRRLVCRRALSFVAIINTENYTLHGVSYAQSALQIPKSGRTGSYTEISRILKTTISK
jgi:hypothetical protein